MSLRSLPITILHPEVSGPERLAALARSVEVARTRHAKRLPVCLALVVLGSILVGVSGAQMFHDADAARSLLGPSILMGSGFVAVAGGAVVIVRGIMLMRRADRVLASLMPRDGQQSSKLVP